MTTKVRIDRLECQLTLTLDNAQVTEPAQAHKIPQAPPAPGLVCTPGRKYALAIKEVADLIGVSTRIKTRYGELCGDAQATCAAYAVAYGNVSWEREGGGIFWAQSGYGKERNPGNQNFIRYRYAEVNGDEYSVLYDTGHAPGEGTHHTYTSHLTKGTGTWSFDYDGVNWHQVQDDGWEDQVGNVIQWTGEIYNREDQMPGSPLDKCVFSNCRRRVDGQAWEDGDIQPGDVRSDDPARYGAERLSTTSIAIWDVNA